MHQVTSCKGVRVLVWWPAKERAGEIKSLHVSSYIITYLCDSHHAWLSTHVPRNFVGQVLHWRVWVPRATTPPSWSKASSAPPATPPTRCARMWNCGKSATTCCSGCPRLTTRFVDTYPCLRPSLPPCQAFRLIGRFYVALISTSEQTHCTLFGVPLRAQNFFWITTKVVYIQCTLQASLSGIFLQNSARFSYVTEGALFIAVQLSTDTVSALQTVWVLIWL